MSISGSKRNIIRIILLLTLAAVVTLLSPSERILGDAVKIVYIHGAMIWVSLMLFGITGSLGVIQLIRASNSGDVQLLAFEAAATGFWFTSTIFGFIVAYITWGGVIWAEPRIWMAVLIAVVAGSIYSISRFRGSHLVNRILAVTLALTVGGLLINAGRILHPQNPIFQSEPIIQIAFITLATIFFVTALLIVRILNRREHFA